MVNFKETNKQKKVAGRLISTFTGKVDIYKRCGSLEKLSLKLCGFDR